ncbi:P2Y purinoceptor 1-like [Petromyzon marinus]|uniref:P2Y purinoceptor 1-like n=1 Tax=Petromyzon marinus TaxID=7757 RepID=UPI003F7250E3
MHRNSSTTAATSLSSQLGNLADFKSTYLPAIYSFVFCVGLLTNVAAIWACCRRARPWNGLAVYTFNLALADLLYVTSLPPFIHYYTHGSAWIFGDWLCRAGRFVFHVNLGGSALFLACVSAHRYAGIVHPLWSRGRLRPGTARAVSVAVWALVAILLLPTFHFVREGPAGGDGAAAKTSPPPSPSPSPRDLVKCYDSASDADLFAYLPYSVALSVVTFAVPFAVTFACYGFVASTLLGNRSVGAGVRRRSLALVAVVLLLFSVSFLPYHVTRNLNLASRLYLRRADAAANRRIYAAYQVCRGLASLNSCFNPIVYFLAREDVRSSIRRGAIRVAALPRGTPLLGRKTVAVAVEGGVDDADKGEEEEECSFV